MSGELNYTAFRTRLGWVGVLGSGNGLLGVTLPQGSVQRACQLLGDRVDCAVWSPHLFEGLTERLRAYFSGHIVAFPDELDLSMTTPFRRGVWEITKLIPYGDTRSYAWVAGQVGKPTAMRAVGQALARNPLPVIIPCHRVLGIDGRLGGYSGGVEVKQRLILLEASACSR